MSRGKPTYTPRFTLTPALLRHAEAIGAARRQVELQALPLVTLRELRQRKRIAAAHHGVWLDNRALTYAEAAAAIGGKPARGSVQAGREVRSYYEALALLERAEEGALSEKWICQVNATILAGLAGGAAQPASTYRRSTPRVGEYRPPRWEDVPGLMRALVAWVTGPGQGLPAYLVAGIFVYQLVTIQPFAAGNGRTARALAGWLLRRGGYDLKGLVDVDRYLARDHEDHDAALHMGLPASYYEANARGSRSDPDLQPWLEFFVGSLAAAAAAVADEVASSCAANPEWFGETREAPPANFHDVLWRLSTPDESFTPATVAKWLGVGLTTVRGWLKVWLAGDLIEPYPIDARRVSAYCLTESWRQQWALGGDTRAPEARRLSGKNGRVYPRGP